MPNLIQTKDRYKCVNDKCDTIGSYTEIKEHEEKICFADITVCEYDKKYDTKNLKRTYNTYKHNHSNFREILSCNDSFTRLKNNLEDFKKLLQCSKGHNIIIINASSDHDDHYYGSIAFKCNGGCDTININLEDIEIGDTFYLNHFRLLEYELLDGKIDPLYYKDKTQK